MSKYVYFIFITLFLSTYLKKYLITSIKYFYMYLLHNDVSNFAIKQ